MSETPAEPTPDEEPAPAPDEELEQEEHESNPPAEEGLPESEPAEGAPAPDEAAPPDAAGESPEPQGLTQAEAEKRFRSADKRFETYFKAVAALWDDEAPNLAPVVVSPSAPPGFIDLRDAGRVPDEMQAPILEFFGFAREQDYEPDPQTSECHTCKGKGKTKTGSHVAGKETRPCPTCNGSGAEGLTASPVAVGGNGTTDEPFTLAEPASAIAPDSDNWNEPRILPDGRENPNYGKQPQFKVPVEPWGITAGLGAQDVVTNA
jgi:hypothetical protein